MLNRDHAVSRLILFSLSVCLLFTQVLFAHQVELSFWESRQQKLPVISSQKASCATPIKTADEPLSSFGTFRKTLRPQGPTSKGTVFHIQDVHGNFEAQKNISSALRRMMADGKIDAIALEGAFAPLSFNAFHAFDDQESVRATADWMLHENKISGSIHAALTSDKPIRVYGIDDAQHHAANVNAYLVASRQPPVDAPKAPPFHGDLKTFDDRAAAFHSNKITLAEFVDTLAQYTAFIRTPHVRTFRDTLALEKSIDFHRVEIERSALLARLLPKLTPNETANLTDASLALRDDRIGQTEFCERLAGLCRRYGFALEKFPTLNAYATYARVSDDLDVESTLAEIKSLEREIYESLAATPDEKKAVKAVRLQRLQAKLVIFALTNDEWNEYKQMNPGNQNSRFGDFYREAEIRDEKMAANLIRASGTNIALVTGGFHSAGIDRRLVDAGYTVITFVPKISKVDIGGASAYLTAFSQKKTPLERMFDGDKLFLAKEQFQASTRFLAALLTMMRHAWKFPLIPSTAKIHLQTSTGGTLARINGNEFFAAFTASGITSFSEKRTWTRVFYEWRHQLAAAASIAVAAAIYFLAGPLWALPIPLLGAMLPVDIRHPIEEYFGISEKELKEFVDPTLYIGYLDRAYAAYLLALSSTRRYLTIYRRDFFAPETPGTLFVDLVNYTIRQIWQLADSERSVVALNDMNDHERAQAWRRVKTVDALKGAANRSDASTTIRLTDEILAELAHADLVTIRHEAGQNTPLLKGGVFRLQGSNEPMNSVYRPRVGSAKRIETHPPTTTLPPSTALPEPMSVDRMIELLNAHYLLEPDLAEWQLDNDEQDQLLIEFGFLPLADEGVLTHAEFLEYLLGNLPSKLRGALAEKLLSYLSPADLTTISDLLLNVISALSDKTVRRNLAEKAINATASFFTPSLLLFIRQARVIAGILLRNNGLPAELIRPYFDSLASRADEFRRDASADDFRRHASLQDVETLRDFSFGNKDRRIKKLVQEIIPNQIEASIGFWYPHDYLRIQNTVGIGQDRPRFHLPHLPQPFYSNNNEYFPIAVNLDGTLIAAVENKQHLTIIDADTAQVIHRLTGLNGVARQAAFSPGQGVFAAADSSANICVWRLSDETLLREIKPTATTRTLPINTLFFNTNGRHLIALRGFNYVAMDLETEQAQTIAHAGNPIAVGGREADWLIFGRSNFFAWNMRTHEQINDIATLAFSPSGSHLAWINSFGELMMRDLSRQAVPTTVYGLPETGLASALAFSPDGLTLAVGVQTDFSTVYLHSVNNLQQVSSFNAGRGYITRIAFSPGGTHLAAGDQNGFVYEWNVSTRDLVRQPTLHQFPITSIAYSPDSRRLLFGTERNTMYILNRGAHHAPAIASPIDNAYPFSLIRLERYLENLGPVQENLPDLPDDALTLPWLSAISTAWWMHLIVAPFFVEWLVHWVPYFFVAAHPEAKERDHWAWLLIPIGVMIANAIVPMVFQNAWLQLLFVYWIGGGVGHATINAAKRIDLQTITKALEGTEQRVSEINSEGLLLRRSDFVRAVEQTQRRWKSAIADMFAVFRSA